jgi:hypothetical protein
MRPGALLREDIADILTSLTANAPDSSYVAALCDAATALGLYEHSPYRQKPFLVIDVTGQPVMIDGNSRELTR